MLSTAGVKTQHLRQVFSAKTDFFTEKFSVANYEAVVWGVPRGRVGGQRRSNLLSPLAANHILRITCHNCIMQTITSACTAHYTFWHPSLIY